MANTWGSHKCLKAMTCARRIMVFLSYSWKYISSKQSFKQELDCSSPGWTLLGSLNEKIREEGEKRSNN